MANKAYFNFIGPVYNLLPTADKDRFGELWEGYEQTFGAMFQKFLEVDANISIQSLTLFSSERWLNYEFTNANRLLRSAEFIATQDISLGLDLTTRFLLHMRIDGTYDFEVNCQGLDPAATTISEIVSKINIGAGFTFASTEFLNTVIKLKSSTQGPLSKIEILPASDPAKDAAALILGTQLVDLPVVTPQFPHAYTIPYERVAGIPFLRRRIREEAADQVKLAQGVDYNVLDRQGIIEFAEEPPETMWAKSTLIDDEAPWNTFGFLMDVYDRNSVLYRQIVQGLWYAFWSGPKPENVRRALYLLFGLPVAQEAGSVISVTPTQITTLGNNNIVRNFDIPSGLSAIVFQGQEVERFQPLVDGISVKDKINSPGFVRDDIGRAGIQRFLLDEASRGVGDTDETKALRLLEEHTFLPQINVDAFISADINLDNVETFLNAIKPLNKTFLFQIIVGIFEDQLDIREEIGLHIDIDVTPNLDSNQTTFIAQGDLDDYETVDNIGLDLDSDTILFGEEVEIEVYDSGGLIDSFIA